MDTFFSFKFIYNSTIKKVRFHPESYDELLKHIYQIFPEIDYNKNISLCYFDSENDQISLSNSQDLYEAYIEYKEDKFKSLKINIKSPSTTEESHCDSTYSNQKKLIYENYDKMKKYIRKKLFKKTISLVHAEMKKVLENSKNSYIVHENSICYSCKSSPIKGIMYSCLTCPNLNICQVCETIGIHSEHNMIKIKGNENYNQNKNSLDNEKNNTKALLEPNINNDPPNKNFKSNSCFYQPISNQGLYQNSPNFSFTPFYIPLTPNNYWNSYTQQSQSNINKAKIISDKEVEISLKIGIPIFITVKFENPSNEYWPIPTMIRLIEGQIDFKSMEVKQIPPHSTDNITIPIQINKAFENHLCIFQLSDKFGEVFGDKLKVRILKMNPDIQFNVDSTCGQYDYD